MQQLWPTTASFSSTQTPHKLACGRAPREVAPLFAGANLVALKKHDKDVRPIAVGEILRRLTGKILVKKHGPEVAKGYLGPGGQVGWPSRRGWSGHPHDKGVC
eukprot:TRINITY_DN4199_c0_g1_i1.p3 TRINITY_DN4199_c0_g1~~TRINITY_DN4199_c0_g1_i1.p3  ORF type:complete len:103 (-),score=19.82 TRINITY_DN4199_c0_g1_i1:326-634(-)